MTTPSTDFSVYRIIREAAIEVGKLQEGSDLQGEEIARWVNRLVSLCLAWQAEGLKLWLQYDLPVTLLAGIASYNLTYNGAKPTRVLDSNYYVDGNQVKRPLIMISRDDYARLSQVTQQGPINSVFVDKQASALVAYFWLVPDATAATGTAHLLIQQQQPTPVSLTDTMALPREWELGLIWGLADEMSVGAPLVLQQRVAARAAAYKEALNNWDVEDASTSFQPDQRTTFAGRGFK